MGHNDTPIQVASDPLEVYLEGMLQDLPRWADPTFLTVVGLGTILGALLVGLKLWRREPKGRPGLVLVTGLGVALGVVWVWNGVSGLLGQ